MTAPKASKKKLPIKSKKSKDLSRWGLGGWVSGPGLVDIFVYHSPSLSTALLVTGGEFFLTGTGDLLPTGGSFQANKFRFLRLVFVAKVGAIPEKNNDRFFGDFFMLLYIFTSYFCVIDAIKWAGTEAPW